MKTKFSGILTLLLAFVVQLTFAQEKTISGTVSDNSGLPLPGVNILVSGTTNGTQTDFDGKYSIKANVGDVLVYSYIGQVTQKITVGTSQTINVVLEEDAAVLEEVVVIGYGVQSQRKSVQSVSVVNAENLENIQGISPQVLLQGQASGVQVVQSSGILGAAPVVNIRGTATISSGSQPLYVIDGVPLNDTDQGTNQGANQGLNPLADLNPDDIESFSVLKDAAAVSIYGSRGANGVILINTKKGSKDGVTRVSVSFDTSITEATDILEVMTASELKDQFVRAGRSIAGLPDGNFDWVDGVQQTGISRNVNASVSGGSQKTSYFVNFSKEDAEGFIIGNALKRTSARVNLSHQAKDWLKVGINLGVSNNSIDRVGSENSTFAPFTSAYLQSPWVLPFDDEGNFRNTGFIANVIAIETLDINDYKSDRVTGNVFVEAEILENLTFKSDFGIDRVFLDQIERSFEINSPDGYGFNNFSQQHKWLTTNTLNYKNKFNEVHSLDILAGIAYEKNEIRSITVEGTGFASDALLNVNSASTPTLTSSSGTNSALYSIFSRLSYDYKGKYLLESSIRRDQSSRFGVENRNGTFYSVGLGWVVTDESFMDNVTFIDRLKLSGSYGTAGNDRIGNFNSLGLFGSGVGASYNGVSGSSPTSISNPELKWELTKGYNFSLSGELFNNRLDFSVDYYDNDTEDLILNVPIPDEIGGPNTITSNVGSLNNKGFDVQLGATLLKSKDFSWYTSVNVGFNTNEITSLPGQNLDENGDEFIQSTASQRAVKGRSVSEFYLIRYVGVNPVTGDAEWLNKDGNVTTSPTADDREYVGSAVPDYIGGWRNTFKYKDFELSLFANFSQGNEIYVDGLRFVENPNSTFNKSRETMLNFWQNPGDNAYVPSSSSSTFATFAQRSTSQLRDGSFFRLKNATIAYNIPKKFLDKMNIFTNIRIFATGTNLFTLKADNLEGIDPEVTDVSSSLGQGETFFTPPQSKTYTIGLRLNF
ncbi:MAG: TonB-dependent receptor [Flavobacteriales bacterium]|nr:TonB-dependent receptor [Flavobacteriales bacterium]NCP60705.1 TonB-dependent receptor [Flavobacteriales bacterium]PIV93710.1 MAG: TonB-dependent receptor [Flavobacteriaceae bacterium CG17_big_fil_post_rev_8_21_14_2_50_33_15]PIY13310.1 MAG: TonB-dependent receptor [Flavobacteriaceae bacterium CG_4_10_14_3_um_filter_33_47]PJB17703.1 MAG: TonB-dependent receptor [Flavobacteriaceae bacterium CG_4_9_14_3_um_filter_33_16]